MNVTAGECQLRATRRDGVLRAMTTETVQIEADEETRHTLTLPHRKTGGIGIGFRNSSMGKHVLNVVENTPAYDSGLEAGDIVIAVDGEPISEMSDEEFIATMTGAVGTRVEFTVAYMTEDGWKEEKHQVTRQLLK